MKKKLLALILSVAMVMSVASLSASAEEEVVDRNTVSDESIAQEGEGPPNAVWVMEPIEDAGTAEGEFVEDIADTLPSMDTEDLLEDAQAVLLEEDISPYSLTDLQIVNMDESGEIPKYAAVYDARAVSGWQKENGYWYYYKNGVRATGWLLLNDSGTDHYYYLDPAASGRMVTGLKTITSDGKAHKYYFTSDGPMAHGWYRLQLPGDSGYFYYYFGVPGRPLTGYMRVSEWLEDTESSPVYWYYLGSDGHMYSYKWLYYREEWFYFVGDGHMLTSTFYTISGELYYFSDSGAVMTGWFKAGTNTYHADSSGALDRGTVQMSEYVTSTFNSSGQHIEDTMVKRTPINGHPRANIRFGQLEVVNGYRRPNLEVYFAPNVSTVCSDISDHVIGLYNSSATNNRVVLHKGGLDAADICIILGDTRAYSGEEYRYAGLTLCRNNLSEWCPVIPENLGGTGTFSEGMISESIIVIDDEFAAKATEEYFKKVVAHEVGHAVGLRHPFELTWKEPDTSSNDFRALMWCYYDAIKASNTIEEYDSTELIKYYP